MVRAVLVTHGMLGTELLRAGSQIYGVPAGIAALSNDGTGTDELVRKIREQLGPDADPVFVFVDVPGGSCCLAGQAVQSGDPRVRVVCGVNLPMLLEFMHHRDRVPADELLERVLSRGRGAIRCP